MKRQNKLNVKPFSQPAHKTVSAGEIMAAGGASAYANKIHFDPQKLYNLAGEPISEKELEKGLEDLARK